MKLVADILEPLESGINNNNLKSAETCVKVLIFKLVPTTTSFLIKATFSFPSSLFYFFSFPFFFTL